MKKIFGAFFIILFNMALFAHGADWYYRNKNLSQIFSPVVWQYIQLAHEEYLQGNTKKAQQSLRKAEDMTLQAKPFGTENWPSDWPRTPQALSILKYATPEAYIYRIIGDYALDNNRNKQAILFFQKYLSESIIPDAQYLYKLASIMTKEHLYTESISVYQQLREDILIKNFHGAAPSIWEINQKIRMLRAILKPQKIWILNMKIVNTLPFFSNINELFKNDIGPISNNEHYKIISQNDVNHELRENNFTNMDVINNIENRDRIIKLLNADYVIEPILYKVENTYILQINVYRSTRKKPYETYQYKNENYEFLPIYFKRFAYDFLEEKIPEQYLLPVNSYAWSFSYENPTNWVSSLKVSDNGASIITGYKNGYIYIFSSSGGIQKTYKSTNEITHVAISPEGRYYAWSSLNGTITLATNSGIILSKRTGNEIEGFSISYNGKFWVYAINKNVFYLDKEGEIFWNKNMSDWIENIKISPDASIIGISCYNGMFYLYNDEGNLLWNKNLGSPANRISFYSNGKYISVGTKNNNVFVYDKTGTEITKFIPGEKITLFSYKKNALMADCGIWNTFFYFPNKAKKTIWDYSLDKNVSFADSNLNADFLIAAQKNSIFAYRIIWK